MKLTSVVASIVIQTKKATTAYNSFVQEVKEDVQSIERAKAERTAERKGRADMERELEELRDIAASQGWVQNEDRPND